MSDAAQRVAIVTGAASGVGREVTRLLAGRGASVVAVDVSPVVLELRSEHVAAIEGDVALAETAEQAVAVATERFGRLDVLVNNAGRIVFKSILDTSEEEWDRVLAVNVKGMFLLCRAAIPVMQEAGGGAIVNTASISGLVGLPAQGAYAASKGAVVQLTRQLAVELAPARIRVNAVAPGAIATPFLLDFVDAHEDPAGLRSTIEAEHPLGRLASAEEIARTIVFLASDEAAFVTGAVLPVDGGFTAR
jgi:NAD(P)-dependent dehydrogenase (short-subunit alcohol dehydrogenase family)